MTDDADLNEDLGSLAKSLASNPDTRKDFLRLMKKARPNLPIPELDVEDQITASRQQDIDRINKLEEQLANRDIEGRISTSRKTIKEKYRLNDTQVEEVEAMMTAKRIGDYDSAARLYQMEQEVAAPTPAAVTFDLPVKADELKGTNINNWAKNEAYKTLREMRGSR